MTWFHVPSLSRDDGPALIVCSEGECYDTRVRHFRAADLGAPLEGMDLDNPCRHVPVLDHAGERYIWVSRVNRCGCGCNGITVSAALTWEGVLDLSDAYRTLPDGTRIPFGLSDGVFDCHHCRSIRPAGEPNARTFHNPYSEEFEPEAHRYCAACAQRLITECPGCETEFLRQDMSTVRIRESGNVRVCQSCYYDYSRCIHCDSSWNSSTEDFCCNPDGESNDDPMDNCRCYSCRNHRAQRRNVIRNYSHKPYPNFHIVGPEVSGRTDEYGDSFDTTLYLGFELEVEVTYGQDRLQVAEDLQTALGDVAYLKEDGSISHGFEIVTHPMTLEYAMSKFNWAALRQMRKDRKLESADNCGLHVHVSKAAFSSPAHELRWLLFWHRNQVAMRALAGRDSTYAEYRDTDRSQFRDIATHKYGARTERYSAINTNNDATHEVRVFASTLFINRLRASLQLVEATVQYTRHLASAKVMKDGGFSWAEFVVWLTNDARRYADLLERIRAVIKLDNAEPITAETSEWGVRNRRSGYIDQWTSKTITIQEKAVA